MIFFRFFHMGAITSSIERIFTVLQDIFYLHLHTLSNVRSWVTAGIKLILVIHLFACGWLGITYTKMSY